MSQLFEVFAMTLLFLNERIAPNLGNQIRIIIYTLTHLVMHAEMLPDSKMQREHTMPDTCHDW